jgi:hypothetical protein
MTVKALAAAGRLTDAAGVVAKSVPQHRVKAKKDVTPKSPRAQRKKRKTSNA